MPEGDSVWRTAKRLDVALRGQPLTEWDLRWARWATTDLRGSTTLEVIACGKHLLHRIDSGHTLHTHLRMEGSWRVQAKSRTRPSTLHQRDVRVLLGTEQHWALGLRLGMVDLVPTGREARLVGHLGPDPLGEDWDPDVAAANLAARDAVSVGAALLDQEVLAGVGTLWASETLFVERVDPRTPVTDLSPDVLDGIVRRAGVLLNQAIGATGRQRNAIYGRRGPCLRCDSPVRTIRVGTPPRDRQLYVCPTCQR